MKIFKIEIENYRLLKSLKMDLQDDLSLVIGKNNTGKTSILMVLEKFLGPSDKFSCDDFNIEFKSLLKQKIQDPNETSEKDFKPIGIKLKLFIEYGETDNLSNISKVMMDLNPDNNVIVLGFEYCLDYDGYVRIRKEYKVFGAKETAKKQGDDKYAVKELYDFLNSKHSDFFKVSKRSYAYDFVKKVVDEENYIDLLREEISTKEIINFKYIRANRDVANKDSDKTLSGQTSKIYQKTETSDEQNKEVELFIDALCDTDARLDKIYENLFKDIVSKVRDFGGIKINESEIKIISTLQHRELLKGNTTVVYKHDTDNQLPEHYNGLGYMNLISMIFEIEILLHEFKREKDKKPADINLLFIEEPEAHTHPQMQYVFIKNIKRLLGEGIKRDDGENRKLQYIISTHSSHIVADSDFDDIKYLMKVSKNEVIAKNLKDLSKEYREETTQYQFLKQYLTISRAEIFFADKAILIEGDTERILTPTIMRKVDLEEEKKYASLKEKDQNLPLLSQNISIVEVGAYSHIFDKFIEFLGIKALIITDLDATDGSGDKCEVSEGVSFSNASLKHFYPASTLNDLQKYTLLDKIRKKENDVWIKHADGNLCVVYQVKENKYHARSFEDAFIHINRDFITANKSSFRGLKNSPYLEDSGKNAYDLATECIKKKTHFALDIIYHSNEDFSNWAIPEYIKEGLLWLKKD